MSLSLHQGTLITAKNRHDAVLAQFRIPLDCTLQQVKAILCEKLALSDAIPINILLNGTKKIDTDSECRAMFPSAEITVIHCESCAASPENIPAVGGDDGGGDDDIVTLNSCLHTVCNRCLSNCLQNSMIERQPLDIEYRPPDAPTIRTLHQFSSIPKPFFDSDNQDMFLPQLIKGIVCPVKRCGCHLRLVYCFYCFCF